MPVEVIMPKVDMDMTAGQVTKWHAGEGDRVVKGRCLFEIETDKAAMEVEAPANGILRDVTGGQGVDIPVGQVIAWIFGDGETYTRQAGGQAAPSAAAPPPVSLPVIATRAPAADGALRASPLARRLAKAAGLDLTAIAGSGPRGRIQKADVLSHQAGQSPASPAKTASDDEAILNLFHPDDYDVVPHDSLRKTIARRVVESKKFVPHFYLGVDCEIDRLLTLRQEINQNPHVLEAPDQAAKVSINDMVIKAMAKALRDVPDANVTWTESNMIRHHKVDVGFAVAIPGGLIAPIVRNADQKPLTAIARETKDLAARARSRTLDVAEYRGGTTSVSNLGMFGTREFSAIINPPHATILAVGAGERRPVVLADGHTVAAATVMTLTLSSDHRAVDGALAAALLAAVKSSLEDPIRLLV